MMGTDPTVARMEEDVYSPCPTGYRLGELWTSLEVVDSGPSHMSESTDAISRRRLGAH